MLKVYITLVALASKVFLIFKVANRPSCLLLIKLAKFFKFISI